MNAPTITVVLPPEQIEQIARRVAELVGPPKAPPAPDELLRMDEAAEVLRISPRSIARAIDSGRLRASKFGKRVLIKRSDIARYLEHLEGRR